MSVVDVSEGALNGGTFSVAGAEGMAVRGTTSVPEGEARGVAVVIHGWTGHKDRNVVPVAAGILREAGLLVHRVTLGHAGIAAGEDRITDLDAFEMDALDNATLDVREVVRLMQAGTIAGEGLPLFLCGHSRGGSQVLRIAATAEREGWGWKPRGVIALAPPSAHTRFSEEERAELASTGYVERAVERAEGGVVRMGPGWFRQHFDEMGNVSTVDVFVEDVGAVCCPVLVVHGGADETVGLEHSERINGLLTGRESAPSEHEVIEGADHNFGAKGVLWEGIAMDEGLVGELKRVMGGFVDGVLSGEGEG